MNELVTFKGTFRLYWNKSAEWPLVWSIDRGDVSTEVKIAGVHFHSKDVSFHAMTSGTNMRANRDREPRGWFEGFGVVVINHDVADVYIGGK